MEAEAQGTPKVTALIVSHNNAGALRQCLAALEKSNTRESMEILVVDNGSIDDSPRLDSEFPAVTFLRIPRNFGRTKALNIGIRTAVGELLFFLSPLVLVQPETIGMLVSRLESEEGAVAVCPTLRDAAGVSVSKTYPLPSPQALFSAWRSNREPESVSTASGDAAAVAWINLDALLVSKYFVKGLNYFDERYGEFLADAELCYQIRRAGKKIVLLGDVTATLQEGEPANLTDSARALLSADFLSGVAAFAGKHSGFAAGIGFRIRAILSALSSALSFRESGYNWKRFFAVVGMRKVDGSQSELF